MKPSRKVTKRNSKTNRCNYCNAISKDVWISKNKSIACCRSCWGNHPIVARATLGKPFPLDIIKQLKSL